MISGEDILMFFYISLCKTDKPRVRSFLDRDSFFELVNLVEDRYVMLHTLYKRSRLGGFRKDDF